MVAMVNVSHTNLVELCCHWLAAMCQSQILSGLIVPLWPRQLLLTLFARTGLYWRVGRNDYTWRRG
jgi:hypothetical protein